MKILAIILSSVSAFFLFYDWLLRPEEKIKQKQKLVNFRKKVDQLSFLNIIDNNARFVFSVYSKILGNRWRSIRCFLFVFLYSIFFGSFFYIQVSNYLNLYGLTTTGQKIFLYLIYSPSSIITNWISISITLHLLSKIKQAETIKRVIKLVILDIVFILLTTITNIFFTGVNDYYLNTALPDYHSFRFYIEIFSGLITNIIPSLLYITLGLLLIFLKLSSFVVLPFSIRVMESLSRSNRGVFAQIGAGFLIIVGVLTVILSK